MFHFTFLPGLRHITLIAPGTTKRFLRSYGGGQPSYTFNLLRASFPRCVLCGIIPMNSMVLLVKHHTAHYKICVLGCLIIYNN